MFSIDTSQTVRCRCTRCGKVEILFYNVLEGGREPDSAELRAQLRQQGWVCNSIYFGPKEIVVCSPECAQAALRHLQSLEPTPTPPTPAQEPTAQQAGLFR